MFSVGPGEGGNCSGQARAEVRCVYKYPTCKRLRHILLLDQVTRETSLGSIKVVASAQGRHVSLSRIQSPDGRQEHATEFNLWSTHCGGCKYHHASASATTATGGPRGQS